MDFGDVEVVGMDGVEWWRSEFLASLVIFLSGFGFLDVFLVVERSFDYSSDFGYFLGRGFDLLIRYLAWFWLFKF